MMMMNKLNKLTNLLLTPLSFFPSLCLFLHKIFCLLFAFLNFAYLCLNLYIFSVSHLLCSLPVCLHECLIVYPCVCVSPHLVYDHGLFQS